MQSPSDDTTACSSPVPSGLYLPTLTPPGPSQPSSLPPRPSPQPPRPERPSAFRPPTTRRDPPVQSQIQQSVPQVIKVVVLSSTFPSFSFSEPGLLGKKVSYLYELMPPRVGYSASNSNFTFKGSHLNNDSTISDYGIVSEDIIQLNPTPVMIREPVMIRKPVIYLYPPSSLADVTVELTLVPSWRFSVVHPPPQTTVPPGQPHTAQSVTWTVAANPNGMLLDKTSGMEVSYLYWEAM